MNGLAVAAGFATPAAGDPPVEVLEALLRAVRAVAWRVELPSGRVTYVSDSVVGVLGYPPERCCDPGFHASIVHPDDRRATQRAVDATLAHGTSLRLECRVIRADGRVLRVHDTLVVLRDRTGAAVGMEGLLVDVTDQAETLHEAGEWRERFEIAAKASGVTLVDYDVANDRCVWHGADGTVFGHDPARIVRFADYVDLVLAEDRDRLQARHAADVARPLGPHVEVYRLRHADGSVRAVETRGELVWSGGVPRRWVGHLVDVTAERELERQLRMQGSVLEALGEAVTVARFDGTLVLVNSALERMYGWSRRELIGQSIRMLTPRSDADYRRRGNEIADEVLARGSWTGEILTRRRDGAALNVLATVTSVVIGSERYFITVRKDVTELRRLEAEVLRISQHEKEQLAHELHEGLGQQLSGISFLASSLRAEAARTGSPLAPQAERLAQLVTDAVGTARRMAQGVTGFVLHHGGLCAALHELGEECERRDGVECPVRVDPEIARRLPDAHAYQLFRIVQEAVACALRQAGARRLSIVLDGDAEQVRLLVADDGRTQVEFERLAQVRRLIGYRAGLLGAALAVRAGNGQGHEIEVSFPLAAPGETGAGDER